mgnify:CR=1 FL=1
MGSGMIIPYAARAAGRRLYLINPSNPLVSMVHVKESRWNRYRVWKPLSLMVLAGEIKTPPMSEAAPISFLRVGEHPRCVQTPSTMNTSGLIDRAGPFT